MTEAGQTFSFYSSLTVLVQELILVDDSIVSHKEEITKLLWLLFGASNLDRKYEPTNQYVVVKKSVTHPSC